LRRDIVRRPHPRRPGEAHGETRLSDPSFGRRRGPDDRLRRRQPDRGHLFVVVELERHGLQLFEQRVEQQLQRLVFVVQLGGLLELLQLVEELVFGALAARAPLTRPASEPAAWRRLRPRAGASARA
jgi:hypothetical protein